MLSSLLSITCINLQKKQKLLQCKPCWATKILISASFPRMLFISFLACLIQQSVKVTCETSRNFKSTLLKCHRAAKFLFQRYPFDQNQYQKSVGVSLFFFPFQSFFSQIQAFTLLFNSREIFFLIVLEARHLESITCNFYISFMRCMWKTGFQPLVFQKMIARTYCNSIYKSARKDILLISFAFNAIRRH